MPQRPRPPFPKRNDTGPQAELGVLAVQNFIGPGITSPNYNVNAVGISYIYRFR